jgi:hypothetical protein
MAVFFFHAFVGIIHIEKFVHQFPHEFIVADDVRAITIGNDFIFWRAEKVTVKFIHHVFHANLIIFTQRNTTGEKNNERNEK